MGEGERSGGGPQTREEESPRFSQRTSGPAVLGPWSASQQVRCAVRAAGPTREAGGPRPQPPAPAAPARASAEGPTLSGLRGRELPRTPGRHQQLVSPQGAAPPFPGTKAAARAGAPGAGREGVRRGLPGAGLGNGTAPRVAPKLPTSLVGVEGGVGAGSARRVESARNGQGGRDPAGRACRGTTRDLRGAEGPARLASALETETRAGARNQRFGNLLQSSDS